jgi:hypothetical protein
MLENKPPVLEDAHRKIMRLEIEKEALKKEMEEYRMAKKAIADKKARAKELINKLR